jgi:outer membrane protein assembly factor BamB
VIVTAAVSAGREKPPIPGLYDPGDEQGSLKSTAEHRWTVYDVDFKTGKIRWQRELHRSPPPLARHIKNTDASETPVTDGERVYVYFGAIGRVFALDLSGRTLWTKETGAYPGTSQFGSASSPALHGEHLYIVNDNATGSFITALDKRTGREIWKVPRNESPQGWATPFVWEHDLRTEIVTTTSDGQGTKGRVRSYDLEGKPLWELRGLTILSTPSPFARNGLLYVSSGYPGASPRPVFAIRPGASGDISLGEDETANSFVAWHQPLLGTYNTSALAYGDYYYTLLDRGFLLCHDARTGRQIYGRQRISAESSGFTASPWAYNGKIFLLSEDGDTFVVEAGPTYKLLGKNPLGEMSMATPAVVRGSIILRTQSHLYRIARSAR